MVQENYHMIPVLACGVFHASALCCVASDYEIRLEKCVVFLKSQAGGL